MTYCIEFYDTGPDALGRRHFALTWKTHSAPIMSTEVGREHIEIGRGPGIRAQHFFAKPDCFIRGDTTCA